VATEAAWLKGTIWKKKEEKERRKREKNERNGLTLTGLLMEGIWIRYTSVAGTRVISARITFRHASDKLGREEFTIPGRTGVDG
jgi:hypothetical protein